MSRFARLAPNMQGILLVLAAVITFTVLDAMAKALIMKGYPVSQVIWARNTGQVLIVVMILRRNTLAMLRTRYPGAQVLRAMMQIGSALLFFSGLKFIGLAEASAIMDLNPVLITLGAAIFLGEPIGPRRIFGVLAAMTGAMIIIRPGSAVFSPYALLPLAAAFTYAGFAILTRRLGPLESHWTTMLYCGGAGMLVMGFVTPGDWRWPEGPDTLLFIGLACAGTVGQLWLVRAFTQAEAGVIAPFGYVGLLFAALWGVLFFDEYPDIWTGIGALVIVGAGLYVWHRETAAARQAARDTGH